MKKIANWFSLPTLLTQKQSNILLISVLFFTAFLYLPVFKNLLTNWDDELYIVYNPYLRNLSFENIKNIFRTHYAGNYHPLTMISLAVNYKISGMQLWSYQLVNLLLHLCNTLLVYIFVKSLIKLHYSETNKLYIIPLVVALLFGIHTFQVESVAWLSERKNVLYALFFILSLIFYTKYLKKDSVAIYLISILFFVLSLFSKGMAVPLSLCLICIDFFAKRKLLSRKVIVEKIPFLAISLIFGVVAIIAQHSSNSLRVENTFIWYERIAFASYGFIQYIIKLCLPYHLSAYYPYPVKIPLYFYAYIALVLLLLLAVWRFARKNRIIIFSSLFFITNISFVIQLLPVGDAVMADRYMYISSIGFFIIVGYYCSKLWKISKLARILVFLFLIIYSCILGIKTYHRVAIWKESLTLWDDVLKNYPENNDRGYLNRGNILLEIGLLENALQDYDKLLKIDPKNSGGYIGRGRIKHITKDYNGALTDFNTALLLIRTYEGYIDRAVLRIDMQDYTGALTDSDSAYMINPNRTASIINKGYIFLQLGNLPAALEMYNYALQIDSLNSKAYKGRALIKKAMRDLYGALDDLNISLSITKSYDTYIDRAIVKMALGDFMGAKTDLDSAMEIDPFNIEVYINKGILELNKGNHANALKEFSMATTVDSSAFQGYLYKAIAKINLTDYNGAVIDLNKSILLQPSAEAFYYRGIATIKMGNKSSGCDDLNQSLKMGYAAAKDEIKKNCK